MEIKDIIGVAVALVYGTIALIVTGRVEKSLKTLPDFNHIDITVAIIMGVFLLVLLPTFFVNCYGKKLDQKRIIEK